MRIIPIATASAPPLQLWAPASGCLHVPLILGYPAIHRPPPQFERSLLSCMLAPLLICRGSHLCHRRGVDGGFLRVRGGARVGACRANGGQQQTQAAQISVGCVTACRSPTPTPPPQHLSPPHPPHTPPVTATACECHRRLTSPPPSSTAAFPHRLSPPTH